MLTSFSIAGIVEEHAPVSDRILFEIFKFTVIGTYVQLDIYAISKNSTD
jgi:hypothetical protein